MLTSLEFEILKGIAARQRIDFAPLTLLFGVNSAGKSTILQALLYLHGASLREGSPSTRPRPIHVSPIHPTRRVNAR